MGIWDFIGGAANYGMQEIQDQEKERIKKMEADALMKRQMALEELRNQKELERQKEMAKYQDDLRSDDVSHVVDQSTGNLLGVTRNGKVNVINEADPAYRQSLFDQRQSKIDLSSAQASAAQARAEAANKQIEINAQRLQQQNDQFDRKQGLAESAQDEKLNNIVRNNYTKAVQRLAKDYTTNFDNLGKPIDYDAIHKQAIGELSTMYPEETLKKSLADYKPSAPTLEPNKDKQINTQVPENVQGILAEARQAMAGTDKVKPKHPAAVKARLKQLGVPQEYIDTL